MSGRPPRAAKSAARSKSASVQKPKPAAAPPKKPAKKSAARGATAPAAAAPPAAPEPTLAWYDVTSEERRAPRTLATWVRQKHNLGFFLNYQFSYTDTDTGEEVRVFRSAFSVKSTGFQGGLRTCRDAFSIARTAYLSRVRDDSELWGDPDAAALKAASREIITRPPARQENGFLRSFRPGVRVTMGPGGTFNVESHQQVDGERSWKKRVIDETKLDALRSKRGPKSPVYRCVVDFADQLAAASDDDQRAMLLDRALNIDRSLEAAALRRFNKIERRVAESQSVAWAEFEEDVGFDEEVKEDLGVESLIDVDDYPLECLLGHKDCYVHKRIMDRFYASRRRVANRGVQVRVITFCSSDHHMSLLIIGGRPG